MNMILITTLIVAPLIISFADKIIEYFYPNQAVDKIAEECDIIMGEDAV